MEEAAGTFGNLSEKLRMKESGLDWLLVSNILLSGEKIYSAL